MIDVNIQREIDRLRQGGKLNPDGVKAIAIGINHAFTELAAAWSKRFSIGAWVDLHTSAPTQLHFCRRPNLGSDVTWTFVILYTHERDELRISQANLEQRNAAARAIPRLYQALIENGNADKTKLLEAFDTVSKYAEEAK